VLAGVDTEAKAARRNAAVNAALLRELGRNTCSRFITSGEDLLALKPDAIAQLKQKLAPFAGDFRVIVYVREPYSYINSTFQQRSRAGATWQQIIAEPPLPRYRRIQKFIDVFGRDHVDIRVFERGRFVNGDLIADFLSAIGAEPELARALGPVAANQSLSHEAALILDAVNNRYPNSKEGKPHPERCPDIADLLRAVAGQAFRCPRAAFVGTWPKIVRDLEWLREALGERVFSTDLPQEHDLPQGWSDETLASLATLINGLANRNRANWMRRFGGSDAGPARSVGFLRRWRAEIVHRR